MRGEMPAAEVRPHQNPEYQGFAQLQAQHDCLASAGNVPILPAHLGVPHVPRFPRARLQSLEREDPPPTDRHQGHPGMDLSAVPMLGIVNQAKRMDFDTLHERANELKTLRLFFGIADILDEFEC